MATTSGEIMSSAIQFLESMGRNAELRHASKPVLYKALDEQQVDRDAQWAILRGDTSRLGVMLGARTNLVCMIALPDADAAEDVERESSIAANA
jgi:hypothetical protein